MDDTAMAKAETLLTRCEPLLLRLGVELGSNDDLYLNVSSAVANKALQLTITAVNENTPRAQFHIGQMPAFVNRAMEVMGRVKALDMVAELRRNVEANAKTLGSIAGKIRSAQRSNNSGCMVTFVAIGVILTLATILLH
ncbi:MAG: hypothetical protein IPK70_17260 [Flavobacteriales bacterium]|nr:hypothetical protein [Flavobacteriales bacterium]